MAVTSGTCYSSYARNTRLKIYWEKYDQWSDSTGCGSKIKWKLQLENGNQWYSNAIKCYAIYINGSKVHDGGTWSNYTSSGTYDLIGWQYTDIAHNNAGNEKTFNINFSGWFYSSYNVSANQDFTLPSIPRETSITSFTVSKRNETSFTFNWATANAVSKVEYSTNNGGNYKDGWTSTSGATSGSFTVSVLSNSTSSLSPSTSYSCKIRVTRKDSGLPTTSSTVTQTTYAVPTQSLRSKTETSITMNWAIDSNASQIRYSSNNGSSWSNWVNVSGTSGYYTISSLSANTSYNIKTEVKRSATSTSYQTSTSSQTTYNYPSCTSAPNFTIGNSVKLDFYNPLNRTMSIRMWSHVSQAFVTDAINVTGTTYTFTPNANTLYASIPNNQSSVYNIDVTYSGNKYVKTGGSYSVNTNSCIPTFSNFAYKDTTVNDLTTAIDDDQILVQNVSNVNVVISSANKMVAKNSATASKYQALFSNLSKTFNYSASDIDTNLGVPTGSGNSTFKVTAYDSRNIAKEVSKTINIIPYVAPVVNVSLNRLNNFEAETHLKVSGTFSRVTISNSDKNLVKSVQYRYKESTASSWGSWTTMTISSQGTGSYQTTELTLSFDNTKQYDFQIRTTDRAKTTTVSKTLSVGQPLMFLDTSGNLEVQSSLRIPKLYAQGQGISNTDGVSIIRDHGNQNVTVDATGKTLYLGFETTTGLNILAGKSTINSEGQYAKSSGGQYIKARDNAVVRQTNTATNNWSPVVSVKTKNGEWSIGKDQSSDSLNFQYTTDTDYDNNTNTGTRYTINTSGNYSGNAATATDATNAEHIEMNTTNPTSQTTYYLPFTAGVTGNVIARGNNGCRHICLEGTTSADGVSILAMGNGSASGTAGNKRGYLRLFDKTTYYGTLQTGGSFTGNRTLTMPNHNGTIQVRATNLYNNTSGSTGTITLSETSADFNYLEIFYCDNNGSNYKCVRVYAPNGKKTEISSIEPATDKASTYIRTSMYTISGTSITRNGSTYLALDNKAITLHNQSAYNKIVRVDGWR